MSRILRLEPASQPQNLQAEPEKLERVTYRSNKECDLTELFRLFCFILVANAAIPVLYQC